MATLAVIQTAGDVLITTIVAELTDICPEGCYFVELPENTTWVNGEIVGIAEFRSGTKTVQEF